MRAPTATRDATLTFTKLVPKDPFIEPHILVSALYAFQHHAKNSPNSSSDKSGFVPLTLPLLRAIETAYGKSRQTEQFKVHKVLLNKLDDLTTDLRAAGAERDGDLDHGMGAGMATGTARLSVLVKCVLANRKDGAPSVRWLWTARAEQAARKRRERVLSDAERDAEDKTAAAAAAADVKSTDDEGDDVNPVPWPNRVQKKIESWAGCVPLPRRSFSDALTSVA